MITVSLFRDLPEERRLSMEIYADRLAEGLKGLFPKDLNLQEVRFPSDGGTSNEHRDGAIARISAGVRRFIRYPRAAARLQGDINHVVDHGYADLVLHIDRRRTVVTCHDLVLLKREVRSLNRRAYSRMALNRFRWYSLRGLERASHVIAISESTRNDLLRYTSCAPRKVSVIPYGVSPSFSRVRDGEKAFEMRRHHDIPEGPIVLHVGHVDFYKNIEGLLRIFAKVCVRMHGQVTLVRVGPHLSPQQRGLAFSLGIMDHVRETGPVLPYQLPAIYHRATVLLFPSLYEGFGMPPLEAMASGLPVVSSDRGSLGEVVGDAGCLRSPLDEDGMASDVCALLQDEARRKEYAERGVQRARLFSWERNATRTREVYEGVLRHGGCA